jgi:hypothetical protein
MNLPAPLEPGRQTQLDEQKSLLYLNETEVPAIVIGDISGLVPSHREALEKFNTNLQNCISGSTVINDKQEGYTEALSSLKAMLVHEGDPPVSPPNKLIIPGPVADEKNYAQPYLLVLLRTLGSIVDSTRDPVEGSSPAKSHVQVDRTIPKTKHRPKRVVDKSISANNRFLYLLRDDVIEIPVEVKPGQRGNSSPKHLLSECENQIISLLAKHVGIGFNFANKGIDTRATGVVLTPAYVKILQLRLEAMGTKDTKLVLLETECMPLMSPENFEKMGKDVRQAQGLERYGALSDARDQ